MNDITVENAGPRAASTGTLCVVGNDLAHIVDFYWLALSAIQNVAEDIEGSDQRLEYLENLRYRLLERLQEMDSLLGDPARRVSAAHRVAYSLEHGLGFLGLSGAQLLARVRLGEDVAYPQLYECLLDFVREALAKLPGRLPAALGDQGQREVLHAMRGWSAAASMAGEDLSFLSARLRDL